MENVFVGKVVTPLKDYKLAPIGKAYTIERVIVKNILTDDSVGVEHDKPSIRLHNGNGRHPFEVNRGWFYLAQELTIMEMENV